jgi:hypothetical protein
VGSRRRTEAVVAPGHGIADPVTGRRSRTLVGPLFTRPTSFGGRLLPRYTLEAIVVVLLILWLLGAFIAPVGGNLIHVLLLVVAVVEDDGCGFDPEPALTGSSAEHRLGILGMRERVALLGGELTIDSGPGRGTTVIANVPLAPRTEEARDG